MSKKKKQKTPSKKSSFLKPTLYVVLALVILMIYGKTTSYDFTIDDKIIIVENTFVKSGLAEYPQLIKAAINNDMSEPGVTRPITMLSHALDVSLFGMEPGPMHMVNIFLYMILILLLFYLLQKYFLKDQPIYIPFFIALLFLVHPVHIESVANIKGRDDILSFIFGVLAILFYFKNLEQKSWKNEIIIFISLLFSFLSKETGVIFTGFIGLSHYFFTDAHPKEAFKSSYKYLILGIILVILRFGLFTPPPKYINIYNNSLLALESSSEQFWMSWRIFLHYFQISVWPHPLVWDYSLGHFEWNNQTTLLGALSILISLVLIVVSIMMLKRKNPIGFGILFFFAGILPASNLLIKIASTFGERLLFIPSFGIIIAFVFLLKWASEKFPTKKYTPQIIFISVSLVFLIMASQRTNAWENDRVLIETDFENTKSIRSIKSYIQLTTAKKTDVFDNHVKALKVCKEGNERFPNDWELWYFNGVINKALKNTEEAKKAYARSLELKDDSFVTLVNYAGLFLEDNPDKAIELFRKAIEVNDDNADVIGNLAILLHQRGDLEEAKVYYERSISKGTTNSNIRNAYQILKSDLGIE